MALNCFFKAVGGIFGAIVTYTDVKRALLERSHHHWKAYRSFVVAACFDVIDTSCHIFTAIGLSEIFHINHHYIHLSEELSLASAVIATISAIVGEYYTPLIDHKHKNHESKTEKHEDKSTVHHEKQDQQHSNTTAHHEKQDQKHSNTTAHHEKQDQQHSKQDQQHSNTTTHHEMLTQFLFFFLESNVNTNSYFSLSHAINKFFD